MIRRRGHGVPYGYIDPTRKETVAGGETNVDTIFDKLKSEMLLVKKDTIAAWVEEFGGEPAKEEKEEKEEEGGGVSEEARRIDRKREEAARRYLLSQGKRLDPQTFVVELQKLKAMTDEEFEKTVTGKKPSILETQIQSPLIRATVSKPLSGEEEGLGLVFSVVGRGGRVVNKAREVEDEEGRRGRGIGRDLANFSVLHHGDPGRDIGSAIPARLPYERADGERWAVGC